MNILIVSRSTTLHFASGGMESHLKILSEGLAASGHNVTVLTSALFEDEKVVRDTVKKNINNVNYIFLGGTDSGLNPLTTWEKFLGKIGFLSDPYSARRGQKNFYFSVHDEFENINNELKFDVVMSQSTAAYGLYSFTKKSLPLIAILHGTILGELKTRWQTAKSFKNYIRYFILGWPKGMVEFNFMQGVFLSACSRIVVVSNELKNQVENEIKRMPNVGSPISYDSKIVVINNGVDSEVFKPSTEKFNEFTCLYVGRIAEEKGISIILDSAKSLLSKDDIKFKIIGTGPDFERFKSIAPKNVDFTGAVDNAKLPEIYAKSHVFVFPTQREEGHPVTFSESMCSGLPYLASARGGLKDLVIDDKNGYFVSNVDQLSEKITFLYKNRHKLEELSANCRNLGLEQYSKDVMINKYLIQINEALNQ